MTQPTGNPAMVLLAETSRTFYIPIQRMVPVLQEATASAYLCMRAIDEIEDHPDMPKEDKLFLLRGIGAIMRGSFSASDFEPLFRTFPASLPEVTRRIYEWAMLCPEGAASMVWSATSGMAEQMAEWVECGWDVRTEEDLDRYTDCVAGRVGLLLSDLWSWYDGTKTDKDKAVGFGRGLQAVNILRNRKEDLERGVDFFPDKWGTEELMQYCRRNLALADLYIEDLRPGPILDFCRIPLALAHATLDALASGQVKLNRPAVLEVVRRITEGVPLGSMGQAR